MTLIFSVLLLFSAAAAAKSLQSCPTLCNHIDISLPGSPHPWDSPGKNTGVGCHFLLQCVKVRSLSRVWLLATPWTAAYQAPPSMGFSRQEDCSGVPLPSLCYFLLLTLISLRRPVGEKLFIMLQFGYFLRFRSDIIPDWLFKYQFQWLYHILAFKCYYFAIVVQSLSHIQLFSTPWTVAHQASLHFTIS